MTQTPSSSPPAIAVARGNAAAGASHSPPGELSRRTLQLIEAEFSHKVSLTSGRREDVKLVLENAMKKREVAQSVQCFLAGHATGQKVQRLLGLRAEQLYDVAANL